MKCKNTHCGAVCEAQQVECQRSVDVSLFFSVSIYWVSTVKRVRLIANDAYVFEFEQ